MLDILAEETNALILRNKKTEQYGNVREQRIDAKIAEKHGENSNFQ